MLQSTGLYQRMVTNNKYVNTLISTGNINFTTENGGMKSWQRADTQKVGKKGDEEDRAQDGRTALRKAREEGKGKKSKIWSLQTVDRESSERQVMKKKRKRRYWNYG